MQRTKAIKIIKEFPNSPELGTILSPDFYYGYRNDKNFTVSLGEYERFPEYFDEVEYNYTIKGFNDGFNDYWKADSGKFTINLQYFYDEADLIKIGHKITAVRRDSDGVVFRVGDTFTNKLSVKINSDSKYELTGFEFDGDRIILLHGENRRNCDIHQAIKIEDDAE